MSTLKRIVSSYFSHFEVPIAGKFKTAADRQRLFYPWHAWGKGYVLPDAQTEQRIRKLLKIYYIVWPLLMAIVVSIAKSYSFYYALAYAYVPLLLLIYGVYVVGVRSLTRGLLTSSERLRVTESWANSARATSSAMLWYQVIVCTLFVICGIWLILIGEVGIGFVSILLFGACGTKAGYMLQRRA